jgi:hypothetical protein
VDGTLAGRAFRFSDITATAAVRDAGRETDVADGTGLGPAGNGAVLWVPVVEGTDRVGVLRLELPAGTDPHDARLRARCWTLASLVGHLIVAERAYSDVLHQVRRTRPLSVASELLGQLLPPRTFAAPDHVVDAVMEPFDQIVGDGYDYAADGRHAYLAVFDSTGHDLYSGLITTAVLAATRNARRAGAEIAQAADRVITDTPLTGFCTTARATVDLTTGHRRHTTVRLLRPTTGHRHQPSTRVAPPRRSRLAARPTGVC